MSGEDQRAALEAITEAFEAAVREIENVGAGRKGAQVPFFGDFAGVLRHPGFAREARWWAKRLREALGPRA